MRLPRPSATRRPANPRGFQVAPQCLLHESTGQALDRWHPRRRRRRFSTLPCPCASPTQCASLVPTRVALHRVDAWSRHRHQSRGPWRGCDRRQHMDQETPSLAQPLRQTSATEASVTARTVGGIRVKCAAQTLGRHSPTAFRRCSK